MACSFFGRLQTHARARGHNPRLNSVDEVTVMYPLMWMGKKNIYTTFRVTEDGRTSVLLSVLERTPSPTPRADGTHHHLTSQVCVRVAVYETSAGQANRQLSPLCLLFDRVANGVSAVFACCPIHAAGWKLGV